MMCMHIFYNLNNKIRNNLGETKKKKFNINSVTSKQTQDDVIHVAISLFFPFV
jgi:hypothetical protein